MITWKVDSMHTDLLPTQRLHFISLLNLVDYLTCSYQVTNEQKCYVLLLPAVLGSKFVYFSFSIVYSVGCTSTIRMTMGDFKASGRGQRLHQPGSLNACMDHTHPIFCPTTADQEFTHWVLLCARNTPYHARAQKLGIQSHQNNITLMSVQWSFDKLQAV